MKKKCFIIRCNILVQWYMNVWINTVYCLLLQKQRNTYMTGTGWWNALNTDVFIMIIISGQWAFILEQWIRIFSEPTWRTSCSWCAQQLHWETPRWYRIFENIEGKFNLFHLVFIKHSGLEAFVKPHLFNLKVVSALNLVLN